MICIMTALNQLNPMVRYRKYTFTARGLPSGDVQNLSGDSHWAFNPQELVLGTTN